MTNILIKPLPHSPSVESVTDAKTRFVVMQLTENILSLKTQLEEVQKAVLEMRRR